MNAGRDSVILGSGKGIASTTSQKGISINLAIVLGFMYESDQSTVCDNYKGVAQEER